MSAKLEKLTEGIGQNAVVMSWDVDGVLLKLKPREQLLTAKAEWFVHGAEIIFQSQNPVFRGTRARISRSFLAKRAPNPEAIAALAHLKYQKGKYLEQGTPFDIAILSDRPVDVHDLTARQLGTDGDDGDVADHWWENPVGQNPKKFKGGIAKALTQRGVRQMHIEDKRSSADVMLEAGAEVYLLKNDYNANQNNDFEGKLTVVDSPMEAVSLFLDSIKGK